MRRPPLHVHRRVLLQQTDVAVVAVAAVYRYLIVSGTNIDVSVTVIIIKKCSIEYRR